MQPPASIKALGDPIYEAFYGLKEQPFAITTDPKFFYLAASHQRAFSELLNGLRRREGVLLVTGETGAGKTTLCRAVIDALGDRTFAAMILNPYMTGAEVLRIVLRDFGLVSHEDLRRGALASADVPQLLDTLEGFLQSLAPLGSHAVIVLDEAQSVPPQTLDQLRILTALEHGGHRLVQLVLCGQGGLLTTLKSPALSALNERITRRVELAPLPPEQVEAYIQHRLGVAGGSEAVSFEPAAARIIAELARGVPRRINVLCDRSLQEGRIEGVSVITKDLVKRAAKALAGVHEPIGAQPVAPAAPVKAAPGAAPSAKSAPGALAASTSETAHAAPSIQPGPWDPLVPPSPVPASSPVQMGPAAPTPRVEPAAELAAPRTTRSERAPDAPVSLPLAPSVEMPPSPPDLTSSPLRADGLGLAPEPAAGGIARAVPAETANVGLMFGQAADEVRPSRWRKIAIAVVGVAALAVAGYFVYAQTVPEPQATLGVTPPGPTRDLGQPASAVPPPEPAPATAEPAAPTGNLESGGAVPPPVVTAPGPASPAPSEPAPQPQTPSF